MTSWLLGKTKQ